MLYRMFSEGVRGLIRLAEDANTVRQLRVFNNTTSRSKAVALNSLMYYFFLASGCNLLFWAGQWGGSVLRLMIECQELEYHAKPNICEAIYVPELSWHRYSWTLQSFRFYRMENAPAKPLAFWTEVHLEDGNKISPNHNRNKGVQHIITAWWYPPRKICMSSWSYKNGAVNPCKANPLDYTHTNIVAMM